MDPSTIDSPPQDIYRLAGVSKTYRKGGRDILAVREVDLDIRDGEWLAVQGKTGHGKTTLLQLLGGLDRPTAGRVTFAGQDLATAPEAQVRRVRASSTHFSAAARLASTAQCSWRGCAIGAAALPAHCLMRRGPFFIFSVPSRKATARA